MKTDLPLDFVLEHLPPTRSTLRLAVVTETWPPEVNGVALTLARLVQGLRARHHAVQLVRPRQPHSDTLRHATPDETLLRGMRIPRYPQLRLGLPARKVLAMAWGRQRPDLVHIATEGPLGWSALKAARQLGIPVTSDFRTNFHQYSQHYGMGWLRKPIAAYLRNFHNQTACTMVPTRSLCAELLSQGFERLHVVSRGVDTRLFDPAQRDAGLRASWGAGPLDTVLLVVGRLAAEKNLGLALDAFQAMAANKSSTVRLVLAGDGPLRGTLQQRCPAAVYAGSLPQEQLARYYASADLLLFPSLTETFGNVTLEALASGLPVLAFDAAAAAECVHSGQNGWLVPPDQPEVFVRTAAELARHPQCLAQARAAARASVQRLDWSAIAAQVEKLMLRAMETPHRSAIMQATEAGSIA